MQRAPARLLPLSERDLTRSSHSHGAAGGFCPRGTEHTPAALAAAVAAAAAAVVAWATALASRASALLLSCPASCEPVGVSGCSLKAVTRASSLALRACLRSQAGSSLNQKERQGFIPSGYLALLPSPHLKLQQVLAKLLVLLE